MAYKSVQGKDDLVMKNHIMVFVNIDNVVLEFLVKALDWVIRILVRSQLNQASSSTQKLTETITREPGHPSARSQRVSGSVSGREHRLQLPVPGTAGSAAGNGSLPDRAWLGRR